MNNQAKPPGTHRKPMTDENGEPRKKLPAWAIWLAVIAFIIFNSFFALFALQVGKNDSDGQERTEQQTPRGD